MDSAVFRAFIRECTLLPQQMREHLINVSDAMTPESRGRIVKRLQDAERQQLHILEDGVGKMLAMQQTMKTLLKRDPDEQTNSTPSL